MVKWALEHTLNWGLDFQYAWVSSSRERWMSLDGVTRTVNDQIQIEVGERMRLYYQKWICSSYVYTTRFEKRDILARKDKLKKDRSNQGAQSRFAWMWIQMKIWRLQARTVAVSSSALSDGYEPYWMTAETCIWIHTTFARLDLQVSLFSRHLPDEYRLCWHFTLHVVHLSIEVQNK